MSLCLTLFSVSRERPRLCTLSGLSARAPCTHSGDFRRVAVLGSLVTMPVNSSLSPSRVSAWHSPRSASLQGRGEQPAGLGAVLFPAPGSPCMRLLGGAPQAMMGLAGARSPLLPLLQGVPARCGQPHLAEQKEKGPGSQCWRRSLPASGLHHRDECLRQREASELRFPLTLCPACVG